jgi:hypothetical protein
MKDSQFDSLLKMFRKKNPSELQVQRWKRVVAGNRSLRSSSPRRRWLELAVASFIGFVIGAAVFGWLKSSSPELLLVENQQNDATFEFVLTKN